MSTATTSTTLLAPDPALPMRDDLLAPTAPGVEVLRCKYRVGESLRVLYRVDGRMVSTRVAAGGQPRWWAFPDDRRMRRLAAVMDPTPALAELLGGGGWASSEVAEYAPERSLTVRAVAADGATSGYVKCFAPGGRDVGALVRRYAAVAARIAAPSPLGWRDDVLALAALHGIRCADVALIDAITVAGQFGAAVAALHEVPPPPGTPSFGRFGAERLDRSTEVIGRARPDVAAAVAAVRRRLAATRPAAAPVLLHGDCHPKNALVADGRVALIDLDQAGIGPAAADVGSYLARLRVGTIVGAHGADADTAHAEAFLAGYDTVRPRPAERSLRWHTAAALLAEQAVRAVNRVRPAVLVRLDEVVDAAAELLA